MAHHSSDRHPKQKPTAARPTPRVADHPDDRQQDWRAEERLALDDEQFFRTFLKRNLNTPPPPTPPTLLRDIYARLDAVDAERPEE